MKHIPRLNHQNHKREAIYQEKIKISNDKFDPYVTLTFDVRLSKVIRKKNFLHFFPYSISSMHITENDFFLLQSSDCFVWEKYLHDHGIMVDVFQIC